MSEFRSRSQSRGRAPGAGQSTAGSNFLVERLQASQGVVGRSPSPSCSRRFEMASTGSKLAQEIHDEFLVCKICLEAYKNPKSLNCLHTFCETCIDNHAMSESSYKKYSDYRDFTCPLCRKRTQLPIGGVKKLPDNFLVSNLTEVVGRQKPSKFPFCDMCKLINRKHKEAASKCLDCAKLLCKSCVEQHRETRVTALHSIFDVEIEKDIECKEHQDEVVRFYCEPCETCICVLCTFNEHKDHEIAQFGDAVSKYKVDVQLMLEECKSKIKRFDVHVESLNACEKTIKEAEQGVHDTAIKFIAEIRQCEKQTIEDLHTIFGKETMEQIENKKEISATVDGLRSTCNLTEVILNGKDIELLLLKKDVQNKLSTLGGVEIGTLSPSVSKRVTFSAGTLDFGFLEDQDTPIFNRMKRPAIAISRPSTNDSNTQTECADSSDSEHSDSDDSDSSDSEDEKPELTDRGVQTEQTDHSSSSSSESDSDASSDDSGDDDDSVEKVDQSTATDEVATEEKAVNTRSRSLQNNNTSSSTPQLRRSPSKDSLDGDNSLDARRRRRRERNSVDEDPSTYKTRSRFLPYGTNGGNDYGTSMYTDNASSYYDTGY